MDSVPRSSIHPSWASDWTGLSFGSPSAGSVRTDWCKKNRKPDGLAAVGCIPMLRNVKKEI